MSEPPRFPEQDPVSGSAQDALGDLWRRIAQAQDAAVADAGAGAGVARADARVDMRTRRPTRRRSYGRLRGGVAVVALGAAVAVVVAVLARRAPLSFQTGRTGQSQPNVAGGTMFTDARSDLPLQFSDGSMMTFRAGSTGRMQRLTTSGAEVALDRGRLDAHVVHADATLWLVHAGPFQVRVTGTRFAVGWSAPNLDVEVYEGAVVVEGALLGAGVPLAAGHRLTIENGVVRTEALRAGGAGAVGSVGPSAPGPSATEAEPDEAPGAQATTPPREAEELAGARAAATKIAAANATGRTNWQASEHGTTPAPSNAPELIRDAPDGRAPHASSPGAVAAAPAAGGPSANSSPPASSHDGDWLQLAQRGAYREAFAAAKRVGWRGLCGRLDARRLLMLGDVARYAGAHAEARQAFEALVTRFPGDRLAADAVFSLGRLAFEAERPDEAARWFRRYVDDWPNGPLGDQAIGRQMECARRLGDETGARQAAEAYLARAPEGPHASLARDVLGRSSDGHQ